MAIRTDRLRSLREERGWTKREFARRCGFGELQIHRYEGGITDPSTTILKLLADVLGVSADYLIGISDNPSRNPLNGELDENEQHIVATYRHEGWTGIVKLGSERLTTENGHVK